jgi:phage tail protein X
MSSSNRVFLFAAVLTAGICAASLFRKPPGTTSVPSPDSSATFTHRLDGPRVVVGQLRSDVAPSHIAEAGNFRAAAPRAALATNSNAPPEFPEASPIGSFPLSAPPSWPVDEQNGDIPRRAPGGGRLHRVEDGDTLASLAERYFGDAARAQDIHNANADKLPPSGALPIGIDLVIPPATSIPRSIPAQPAATQLGWQTSAPPSAPSTFAEPATSPADFATTPLDNPVAPGVIRPASE